MNYLTALRVIHQALAPSFYLEIGCRNGASLDLAQCPRLAIDPDPEIRTALSWPTRIFRETSDAFFARPDVRDILGRAPDLAFIDGMHLVEYALRDFINLEAHAHPGTVIVIDDVVPGDIAWASRDRNTQAWTGDVYRLIPLLRQYRPDLEIAVFEAQIGAFDKGLAVVCNLDPRNRVLHEHHETISSALEAGAFTEDTAADIRARLMVRPAGDLASFADSLSGKAQPAAEDPAALYLDLLKRSLLNEIYLDDELRLLYLRDCLAGRESFAYPVYHDIRNTRRAAYEALQERREVGQFPERDIHRSGFSHTMMGRKRLDSLQECLDSLRRRNIPGDLVECGVWRGGGCIFMAGYLKAYGLSDRRVLVADSFDGLPKPTALADAGLDLSKERFPELAVPLETVQENFAVHGLLSDRVVFLQGWFKDTLPDAPTGRIALLRLDGDLYESTMDALQALYDRVAAGGIVIIDDYGALEACRAAVRDFFGMRGAPVPKLTLIDWTGAWFVKPDAAAPES